MTYIFIDFEGIQTWIEVSKERTALRQITIVGESHSISCFEPCLADQEIDIVNDCAIITQEQFENLWEKETREYQKDWLEKKAEYPLGKNVSGKIRYFYPQGIIIDLGKWLGCVTNLTISDVQIGNTMLNNVNGVVSSYDEKNMWIMITGTSFNKI